MADDKRDRAKPGHARRDAASVLDTIFKPFISGPPPAASKADGMMIEMLRMIEMLKKKLATSEKECARLRKEIEALTKREHAPDARSGAIPDGLWRDLMLCLHPDRSVTDKVLARTFNEMRQRESVLRSRSG